MMEVKAEGKLEEPHAFIKLGESGRNARRKGETAFMYYVSVHSGC